MLQCWWRGAESLANQLDAVRQDSLPLTGCVAQGRNVSETAESESQSHVHLSVLKADEATGVPICGLQLLQSHIQCVELPLLVHLHLLNLLLDFIAHAVEFVGQVHHELTER